MTRPRVFISYTKVEPDESIARQLYGQLKSRCDVFFDQIIEPGADWADRLQAALLSADVFVVLLSKTSVQKAGVRAEVEVAAEIRERGGGKPLIIPVRVRFRDVLDIPLLMRLQHLQAWSWNDERDTLGLASWILAGKRDPGAQPVGRPANLRLVRQIRAGAVGLPMRILGARGVAAIGVVADGSRAVSAIDTTVRVWDARYGAELFQLGPFKKGVYRLTLSADGRFALTASADRLIVVWDLTSGARIREHRHAKSFAKSLLAQPDSARPIMLDDDNRIVVWDTDSEKPLHTLSEQRGE